MWCVRLGWAVKSLLLPSLVCGRSLTGRSVTAALLTVADRCGNDVCCRWNGVASSRWSWRHGQSAVCAVEERLPWRRAPVDAAQRLTPAQVRPSLNYTAFQKGRHQTHGGYSVNSQRIFHFIRFSSKFAEKYLLQIYRSHRISCASLHYLVRHWCQKISDSCKLMQ